MKANRRFLIIITVLLLAALACQIPNLTGTQADPTTAPGSTPSPKALFSDDFSDPSSGWDRVDDPDGTNDYYENGYRILVNKANWYFWSNPGLQFTDVVIDVDARKNAGPDKNDFGVICRYKDEQNFYFFTVGSDGYYAISKIINGEEFFVGMDQPEFNDTVIQLADGANHLTVECVGDRLTLSVNGTVLADVKDVDLTSGDVGLIAGTYETTGVDIFFDNFLVTRP